MNKKLLFVVGITPLFLGTCITPTVAIDNIKINSVPISSGNTLYVGGSGEGNYTKIQDAIDNASNGDTVFVYDDSSPYYENVIVDKKINLIGENKDTTVIDGGESGDVVKVTANRVNISRFMIENSGYYWDGVGIQILSNHTLITGNTISNNGEGIYLRDSNSNIITGNIISNSYGRCGLYLDYSSNNIVTGNTILNNENNGIYLYDSHGNTISGNTITNNKYGIDHFYCQSNTIKGNNITWNKYFGICSSTSKFITISGNTISNNNYGISLDFSLFNTVLKNNFIDNERDAYFSCLPFPISRWSQNFWGGPRILPKCIFGEIVLLIYPFEELIVHIPWINIDWRPALKPYDI